MKNWISILVTAPERKLMAFQEAARGLVELFDRRGQTVRCRCFGRSYAETIKQESIEGNSRAVLDEAVRLAAEHDVTVQEIHGCGETETYPVLHLGTHKLEWPKPYLELAQ